MMNIQAAKDQIKDTVDAYLQKDDAGMYIIHPSRQRPMFLVGAPGIGKTAIIEQIAQELGIGVVSYSMTHHTRQSALGLPRIVHCEFEGFEYEASEYTMSEIVSSVYDYMERTGLRRGILFLDEINCVSETLYPSMLQFLQFKTFGRHRVPKDWIIVCAGNPPEYNKSVHEFDIVTLDRLREIDVEPDYPAWKRYATEKGIHPVVTTFLEAKPDCFYKVESKPGGGKSFVTARGWEDLGEVITLYEQMGKTVDIELFTQFLRDDEICDRFAVYYKLFDKYRSDYQINRILAGQADRDIYDRAKEAEFDERLALLGLLLDSVGTQCKAALDQESVVVELRDMLRAAKGELLDGRSVEEAVVVPLRKREEALEKKVAAGTAKPDWMRRENLVVRSLRLLVDECELSQTMEGEAAFNTINAAYRKQVDKIKPLVEEASSKMNNAFDFVEASWGNMREMLVFVAELTTRASTTQFIAHYGNDKYYKHNDELQVDATRSDLTSRIRELGELERSENYRDEFVAESLGGDMAGASGIGHASQTPLGKVSDSSARQKGIWDYYDGREAEWGFASMSRMTLPGLKDMRVLDVCCRRGKGVYKISARVGEKGRAIGVDWSEDYIRDAKAGMERAWHDNHLKANNMEFHVACPEDLMAGGIGDNSVDAVYINNIMTLVYDTSKTLSEFFRVLKPGGLLICETVFSDKERDEATWAAARDLGNSIQAGRTQDEFFAQLADAGFAEPEIVDELPVDADTGFKFGRKVPVVPSTEDVKFTAVAINVRKPE